MLGPLGSSLEGNHRARGTGPGAGTRATQAIASTGGETQVQLAFATNLIGKRIIMIPSGNALNLQTLDLNKALESVLRK